MSSNAFEPRPIDTHKPSPARIYHHMITGEVIFESDLPFIHRLYEEIPFYPLWARHNRRFLTRAVRYMIDSGIRQFLDIGSGLPTGGNTHEVARELAPDARVVYVDNDEEAINRARDLLRANDLLDSTVMLDADLRDPARILEHPETRRLIDFSEPVGLLLVSVLPWVPDAAEPAALLARLRTAVVPGSALAMTHVSLQDAGMEIKQQVAAGAAVFSDTSTPVTLRTREQFETFFDGWKLVEPGITYATDWHPDQPVDTTDYARPCNFAAIGTLP
ncbi:SAM-dependent methyltransferase [Nocardia acidivorans]|uniref:SAM-dependent methyltransferase n=1 Tax=Nocardia acidivorans TaxID=404580 RepID=UPI0008298444|nr:SAM-dependent methyltransferase [Nocardia acidivorans]